MLKAIRYILAAICLAASFSCLALWGLTITINDVWGVTYRGAGNEIGVAVDYGYASCWAAKNPPRNQPLGWRFSAFDAWEAPWFFGSIESKGRFGVSDDAVYFPLWYPALVFGLAAVVAMRIGRQFTLRSALVGTSVVAALLGMVVAL